MSTPTGTGFLVGRFQLFEMDNDYCELFYPFIVNHKATYVFLGSNPAPSTHNPISFHLRKSLFIETFGGDIEPLEMPDMPDDRIWSQELDRRIMELHPEPPVVLYGTSHGLKERYSGKFPVELFEINPDLHYKSLSLDYFDDWNCFRAGAIGAVMSRPPVVYTVLKLAAFNEDYSKILLLRKHNETKFRFPGTYANPVDQNYEFGALRGLAEACGEIAIRDFKYVGSCPFDDWRYRDSIDTVQAVFYSCIMAEDVSSLSDEYAESKWFDFRKLKENIFVPEHRDLFEMLEEYHIGRE